MLCSLFALFPVIAAEPEAVPVVEMILRFRNHLVSWVTKQYGVGPAFTTHHLSPTYRIGFAWYCGGRTRNGQPLSEENALPNPPAT